MGRFPITLSFLLLPALAFVGVLLIILEVGPQFFVAVNLSIWLLLLITVARINDLFSLYYLIFGVFFILPFVLVSDENMLQQGMYFSSIWLSNQEAISLQLSIFTFLGASWVILLFSKDINRHNHSKEKMGPVAVPRTVLTVFFVIIVHYNFREASAIYNEGYSAVFDGSISVKKSLLVFVIEQAFIVLTAYLLRRGDIVAFTLFVLYCVSVAAVGQRMPALMLILLSASFFFFRFQLGFRLYYLAIPLFLVLPPVLMVIQDLREGYSIVTLDWSRYYSDIWRVIGMGVDPLKAAIAYDGTYPVQISPFAKGFQIINVIGERVFDVQVGLYDAGFGNEFTRALAPEIFLLNRTFASASVAEAFFFGGLFRGNNFSDDGCCGFKGPFGTSDV